MKGLFKGFSFSLFFKENESVINKSIECVNCMLDDLNKIKNLRIEKVDYFYSNLNIWLNSENFNDIVIESENSEEFKFFQNFYEVHDKSILKKI